MNPFSCLYELVKFGYIEECGLRFGKGLAILQSTESNDTIGINLGSKPQNQNAINCIKKGQYDLAYSLFCVNGTQLFYQGENGRLVTNFDREGRMIDRNFPSFFPLPVQPNLKKTLMHMIDHLHGRDMQCADNPWYGVGGTPNPCYLSKKGTLIGKDEDTIKLPQLIEHFDKQLVGTRQIQYVLSTSDMLMYKHYWSNDYMLKVQVVPRGNYVEQFNRKELAEQNSNEIMPLAQELTQVGRTIEVNLMLCTKKETLKEQCLIQGAQGDLLPIGPEPFSYIDLDAFMLPSKVNLGLCQQSAPFPYISAKNLKFIKKHGGSLRF